MSGMAVGVVVLELPKPPEFEAARDRLDALIRELADNLGPQRLDADGDPTGELIPNVMLSQWVLVAAWVDPDNGEHYVTRCNVNAPWYQITGLLQASLDDD